MHIRAPYILLIAVVAGTGALHVFNRPSPPVPGPAEPQVAEAAPEQEIVPSKPDVRSMAPTAPQPETLPLPPPIVVKQPIAPVETAVAPVAKHAAPPPLSREEQLRIAHSRHWQNADRNFRNQMLRLNGEANPDIRKSLIQSIAAYVRMDTLGAIEWATQLENPEEQRLALEAINKHALVGIGAKIEMDATGFPKIRETTVMSAVGSTGMVEPGDYIVGMDDGNGERIYFNGLSMSQIVQLLRGQAGSEIRLLMERISGQQATHATFEVPVQRSLIVIEPPF